MMYQVTTEWRGYRRGTSIYEVEADNEEDARQSYAHGVIQEDVLQDDTEEEILSVEVLE